MVKCFELMLPWKPTFHGKMRTQTLLFLCLQALYDEVTNFNC